jgi:hypothetical protein
MYIYRWPNTLISLLCIISIFSLRFTLRNYDPSLTGRSHRNPNETFDGAFRLQNLSRASTSLGPYYVETPVSVTRPLPDPEGHIDEFNRTRPQLSEPIYDGAGKLMGKKNELSVHRSGITYLTKLFKKS